MSMLQSGSLFGGRYLIERCIAKGGMGAVYEVVHIETDRRRALKVMQPHLSESASLRDRFRSEARATSHIDSDYIVEVFDAGIDEATQMPFLVMELLRGEELGVRLKRLGRFTPADAVTYLWHAALALEKTHKANIIHRDLKPQNLFLTLRDDGPPRVKILDFGVAKLAAETSAQSASTRSLGTPMYMAPEQFRAQRVTPESDNYALAMVAYTFLVGEPYWAHEAEIDGDIIAFALAATMGPPDSASTRAMRKRVELSPRFDRWFAVATAVDQTQRFSSATGQITALANLLGVPLDAPPRGESMPALVAPPAPPVEAPLEPLQASLGGTRAPVALRANAIAARPTGPYASTTGGLSQPLHSPAEGESRARAQVAPTIMSGSSPFNAIAITGVPVAAGIPATTRAAGNPNNAKLFGVILAASALILMIGASVGGWALYASKKSHASVASPSVSSSVSPAQSVVAVAASSAPPSPVEPAPSPSSAALLPSASAVTSASASPVTKSEHGESQKTHTVVPPRRYTRD